MTPLFTPNDWCRDPNGRPAKVTHVYNGGIDVQVMYKDCAVEFFKARQLTKIEPPADQGQMQSLFGGEE